MIPDKKITAEQRISYVFSNFQSEFMCPITQTQMKNPVCTEDGHSYEQGAIFKWLLVSKKSPKTGLQLQTSKIIPNFNFKQLIQKFNDFKADLLYQFFSIISQIFQYFGQQFQHFKNFQIEKLNRKVKTNLQTYILKTQNNQINSQIKERKELKQQKTIINEVIRIKNQKIQPNNLLIQNKSKLKINQYIQHLTYQYPLLMNSIKQFQNSPNIKQKYEHKIELKQNLIHDKIQSSKQIFQLWVKKLLRNNDQKQIKYPQNLLFQPYQYLLQKFNFEEQQITDRYRKDRYSHQLGLQHNKIPIQSMILFVKYDWNVLSFLNLSQCKLTDNDWKTFMQNFKSVFSRLNTVWLYGNNISIILQKDLNNLKNMKEIQFWHYNGLSNPFTIQTKQNIRKFKQKNPNIFIEYSQ